MFNFFFIFYRSLNTNQSEVSAHRLAQCFIKYGKMRNTNSLFALYMSQTIRWSPNSLLTLILCCEHTPLPDDVVPMFNTNLHSSMLDTRSVKLRFIEWLLNTPWFKVPSTIFIESLSNILIGIPVKFFHENNTTFKTSGLTSPIREDSYLQEFSCDYPQFLSYKNIETCNLALTFQIDLFAKVTRETVDSQEHLQESLAKSNVNLIDLKDVLVILKKYLYDIIDKKNENNDIRTIVMKITLAGKVATTVKRMNILMEDDEIHFIMCVINDCLQHAYSLLETIKLSKNNHEYIIDIIEAFLILYETFCFAYTDMTKIIISLSTADILRNLFDLLNIENDDNFSYHEIRRYNDNFDIFQNKNKRSDMDKINYKNNDIRSLNIIRIKTIRTLTLFGCMSTGIETPKIQLNVMTNLMVIDNYDLSFLIDFKMATIVLETFTQCDKEILHEKYKDAPVSFLLDLFQKCKKDEKYVRYLLKVLPYFIEYTARYDYDLIVIMDTICNFCKLLNDTKFGPIVHIDFLECLARIIEIEPLLTRHKQYTQCQYKLWVIIENLLTYMQNPLHILRLKAIKCMQKLYSSKCIEYERKVSFFKTLKNAVDNLLSIEKINYNNETDEIETRTASALLIFATIICTSSTLQSSALVIILLLAENKHVKLQMVKKLLHSIRKQTEHAVPNEDNLTHMLSHWLKMYRTMETFPWELTQCESQEEFYKTHINTIVLTEIQNFNVTNAKKHCTRVGYNFKDVFENIFAQVLSWLLALVCQSSQQNSNDAERAHNMLHELTLNRENFETIDTFSSLFKTNFDKVIVNIIMRLHDEEHFHQMFQLQYKFPNANTPVLNATDAKNCLRYIEENFVSSKSLQYHLATKEMSKLQKILMNLVKNIYDVKFTEYKLKALLQYIYFCTVIMEGSKFNYFDSISIYLIREISYSLIHFIKDKIDILSETACKYFHIFLKNVLPERRVEIEEHLNYYVTILVPVAQSEKTPIAIELLEYLIIEQKELFSDAIGKLNMFPNQPKFQRILNVYNSLKYKNIKKYDLEEEIQHFLNATNQKIVNCNVESITYLKLQLSTRRDELQELYNKLDNSSMQNYNLLHQLICRLLEIIKSNQAISIEATKCLGQLGPIDLGTTILYNRKSYLKDNSDISNMLTYEIVTLLTEFLVDNDIKLRIASANALDIILSSTWGQKIFNKNNFKAVRRMLTDCSRSPLRLEYIRPFIHEVKNLSKNKITLDPIACNKYIKKDNPIWIETSNISYAEWIVRITCNIIECFSGYYFENLIPVCKLSIEMCELILPRIIFLIMYINKELAIKVSHCINEFFFYHFNDKDRSTHGLLHSSQYVVHCDRNIVYVMLNLVNFIRTQTVENIPLELDFVYIAKAAQYCSAYFTAFFYAELSCESLLIEPRDFSRVTKIDYAYECEPVLGRMLQNILRDASSKIGDPDAIHGCGSSHLQDSFSRVQHYIEMHEWDKVLLVKDIELSSGNKTAIEGNPIDIYIYISRCIVK